MLDPEEEDGFLGIERVVVGYRRELDQAPGVDERDHNSMDSASS